MPYSNGFTLLIDGQEAEAMRANFGFYAIPCEAGEHTLEFVFRQPGATAGSVLSVFGAFGYMALVFFDKRGVLKNVYRYKE